jgi:hypothetical protein
MGKELTPTFIAFLSILETILFSLSIAAVSGGLTDSARLLIDLLFGYQNQIGRRCQWYV